MALEIRKAVRRALPMQIAFYSQQGAGKTFSALMLAAGLVPDGKQVGVLDSERGRASLYADNKKIMAALPQGFDVAEIENPYHPKKYTEAIEEFESRGYGALVIDSGSDSWDGPGGCCDIAEAAKGMWNGAKLANKRMMTRAALSTMHIIWCLKAQEKTKIIGKEKTDSRKQEYIDLGVQPIWEKNNLYPMLLAFHVQVDTHLSRVVKCHDDLWDLFKEPKLITKQDGERLRLWNDAGQKVPAGTKLQTRGRSAAECGTAAYSAFFGALSKPDKKFLIDSTHAENKAVAARADGEVPDVESLPDPVELVVGTRMRCKGEVWAVEDSEGEYRWARA